MRSYPLGNAPDIYIISFIFGMIIVGLLTWWLCTVVFDKAGHLFAHFKPVHTKMVRVIFVGIDDTFLYNSNINPCIKGNRILLDSQQGKKIELVDPNKIFTPADENHKGIVTYKGDLVISFHKIEP